MATESRVNFDWLANKTTLEPRRAIEVEALCKKMTCRGVVRAVRQEIKRNHPTRSGLKRYL
jgi:hypothetical protein